MKIHNAPFPNSVDDPTLTLNIPTCELQYLFGNDFNNEFFSRDQNALPGEDAQTNVSRVYKSLNLTVPKQFTSLALRIPTDGSSVANILKSYGDVVLVFDLSQLAKEILVLNGDVKDIGEKVADTGNVEWARSIDPLAEDFASKLEQMVRNSMSTTYQGTDRRVGTYFEARLPRAITPTDVSAIYIAPENREALAYVQSFRPA